MFDTFTLKFPRDYTAAYTILASERGQIGTLMHAALCYMTSTMNEHCSTFRHVRHVDFHTSLSNCY